MLRNIYHFPFPTCSCSSYCDWPPEKPKSAAFKRKIAKRRKLQKQRGLR